MGFQFQSLAAAGPALTSESAISYTALGTLMGVYLLPGGFLAIPSGWLGKRFGDKRLVVIGLAMMTLGGAVLATSQVYQIMLAGRLIAGIGAVLLNVLVTKMVTDWFAGSRIVTAMGVLIASWPLGISIALMIMAPLTEVLGLELAFAIPAAVCALALLLVAIVYTDPASIEAKKKISTEAPTGGLSPVELKGALLSGCVWCFYNIALILPLSFGAEFLITKGISLASAGAIVSLTSLLIIPALPIGAWIADHLKKPTTIMVVSFMAIAGIIWMIPFTSSYTVMFAILGLIFGPAGGLIMALPSQVLRNENRAVGMGIFFSVYYIGMGIFPAFAGYIRDVSADPAAPFWVAGSMIILAILALLGYRILLATHPRTEQ